jgi:hypothetical protein
MSYRLLALALAVAAFSSMHAASVDAQSVYVAPGGVYVGSGPVYVIPPPTNGTAPYVAPAYGYGYGPPEVVAPPPAVVAPTVYSPSQVYYGEPRDGYYGEPSNGYYGEPSGGYYGEPSNGYYGASNGGYYGAPLLAYGARRVLRPPVAVPHQSPRLYGRGTPLRRRDLSAVSSRPHLVAPGRRPHTVFRR